MVYQMEKHYSWKFEKPVAAAVAGERLERLEREHGKVTPQIILDDARPDNSPLHKCFEWDDAKAAEEYRLQQARGILTALTVTVETTSEPIQVRAFVNVSPVNEKVGSVVAVIRAMSDEESKRNVLNMAMRELRQFEKKYSALKELADVFTAIHAVKVA